MKSRREVVELKLDDLAKMLGKTRPEIEELLRNNDVIELNLNERKQRNKEDEDELKIYE